MHIQPHSQARNYGEEGRPPLPFLRMGKSTFGKKGPDCYWVKFSIQNIVLRVSRRKNLEMFPCGASFSCVFGGMFIEAP